MKQRLWFLLKWVAVGASVVVAFAYGFAAGHFELFPFNLIKRTQSSTARYLGNADRGKKLFQDLCASCHGYDGSGGDGPGLNQAHLRRAADDEALRDVIVNGIENGGMPPVRQTSATEQNDLIAYVRTLGRATSVVTAGNADRGRELYHNLHCSGCHIINGQGNGIGPELTQIARSRGPDHLRKALTDPGTELPRGIGENSRGFIEFLPVRIVTLDGREIRGMRVNEDTFTIQLRDARNALQSFAKSELRELKKEPGQSEMPSYRDDLTAAQLDDLVAYLSRLRGSN
jgi:putative heme-binding domain-containing protein